MTKLVDKDGVKIKKTRVAICVPSQDTCAVGFAHDLARLAGFMGSTRPDVEVMLFTSRGTIIPQQRTELVKYALQHEATHIMWLDSDMRFPKETINRLLAHNESIVGANYTTRRPPITPTAAHPNNLHEYTRPESTGLVEVTRMGMGCMLVDMKVYQDMPAPWFALGYVPSVNDFVGEDVFFCQKSKSLGFPVLCDHELSKDVVHLGEFPYQFTHAILAEAAAKRQSGSTESPANGPQ